MNIKNKIIAATPMLCLIFFLAFGFIDGNWHPTWMIFFLIPIMPCILGPRPIQSSYPLLCTVAFLAFGFLADAWSWCWIFFLTIPVFYIFFPKKNTRNKSENHKYHNYSNDKYEETTTPKYTRYSVDGKVTENRPQSKIKIDDSVNFDYYE